MRGSAVRKVGMRDDVMMVGTHTVPPGRRHWRSDASAFAIVDYHGTPLMWVEGDQVVGEMALVMPKPKYAGRGEEPLATDTLLWFEVVKIGGMPMIRTWWARGKNTERTQRVAKLEILEVKTWPERVRQLLQLMGWVN